MNFVRLLPVFISFLLIGAHFLRAGATFLALICLLAPCLLIFTRPWSVRLVQALLILSAVEWLRTLIHLVQLRMEMGFDWIRLAIILGGVILFSAGSALIFLHPDIKKKYGLGLPL